MRGFNIKKYIPVIKISKRVSETSKIGVYEKVCEKFPEIKDKYDQLNSPWSPEEIKKIGSEWSPISHAYINAKIPKEDIKRKVGYLMERIEPLNLTSNSIKSIKDSKTKMETIGELERIINRYY